MITTFNEYEKINEGWRGDLTALMILVASVMTTDSRNPLDNKTIENYVKTMNIANQDTLVQQAIKDFKDYVRMDSQILNKQEVYTKIDNTPILYRKNDAICYKLYQQMKNKYPSMDASCWCSTTSDGKSVIFLAKDASYNVMLHELSHAIEPVVKIDPRILDNFDFNKNRAQIGFLYMMMTDFNFKMTSDLTREKAYFSNPSEVWDRINNLKMFLYKHKMIRNPNDVLTEEILWNIISGKLFRSLNPKDKQIMRDADFMQLLMFLNLNKYKELDKMVKGAYEQVKKSGQKFLN